MHVGESLYGVDHWHLFVPTVDSNQFTWPRATQNTIHYATYTTYCKSATICSIVYLLLYLYRITLLHWTLFHIIHSTGYLYLIPYPLRIFCTVFYTGKYLARLQTKYLLFCIICSLLGPLVSHRYFGRGSNCTWCRGSTDQKPATIFNGIPRPTFYTVELLVDTNHGIIIHWFQTGKYQWTVQYYRDYHGDI